MLPSRLSDDFNHFFMSDFKLVATRLGYGGALDIFSEILRVIIE